MQAHERQGQSGVARGERFRHRRKPGPIVHRALVVPEARGFGQGRVHALHGVRPDEEDVHRSVPTGRVQRRSDPGDERDLRRVQPPREQQRHRVLHSALRRPVERLPVLSRLPRHARGERERSGGDHLHDAEERRLPQRRRRRGVRLQSRDSRHLRLADEKHGSSDHAQAALRRLPEVLRVDREVQGHARDVVQHDRAELVPRDDQAPGLLLEVRRVVRNFHHEARPRARNVRRSQQHRARRRAVPCRLKDPPAVLHGDDVVHALLHVHRDVPPSRPD
mmetsp:Transcript_14179/g.50963  ORF Transcript_14179/g.50963 Transcript_14179/m.50963 type:complete len:278 (-) Transcript_14179:704-1537(-)